MFFLLFFLLFLFLFYSIDLGRFFVYNPVFSWNKLPFLSHYIFQETIIIYNNNKKIVSQSFIICLFITREKF